MPESSGSETYRSIRVLLSGPRCGRHAEEDREVERWAHSLGALESCQIAMPP